MALRFSDGQLEWIVDHILRELEKGTYLRVPCSHPETRQRLLSELKGDIQQEVKLEKDAKDMLEQQLTKLGSAPAGMDEHKAYLMIKKQLAKDRGIIL